MSGWKQYVYTVILCICICKVIMLMVSDARQKSLIQLICGIFLGICMLQPLSGLNPEEWMFLSGRNDNTADTWVAQGEEMAREAKNECITAACETYILDKAKILGAEVLVEVFLNEDGIPFSAELSGKAAPDVQMQLQNILTTDMGIPKENQIWIWNQENRNS